MVFDLTAQKGSLIVGVDARDMISVNEREGEVYLEIPSAKLSSFAVRYSFVTPFPTLRAVMGEDEREDAENEVEEEEEQKASQSAELEIYAGVAGGFQRLFNKVELEWEDGETELREVMSGFSFS